VVEYVLLLRTRPGADPQAVAAALDAAWSRQYLARGVRGASVGAVDARTDAGAEGGGGGGGGGPFTHLVHYRLGSAAALAALTRGPAHAELLRGALEPLAGGAPGGVVGVAFEARVPRDLEALFRRGDDFAAGSEVLLLLSPPGGGAGGAGAGGAAGGPPGGGGGVGGGGVRGQGNTLLGLEFQQLGTLPPFAIQGTC
jgi:hypothetical protein